MTHARPVSTLAAALLVLCVAAPGPATAADGHAQNGSGACSPALPAFEGNIRKRPLALQNEGTATAFVSCSLVAGMIGGGSARRSALVYVGLVNNTGAALDVTCTLVDGIANLGAPNYIAKTASIPAGSSRELVWGAADNSGQNYVFSPSVSCGLPVGAGVSYTAAYAPD